MQQFNAVLLSQPVVKRLVEIKARGDEIADREALQAQMAQILGLKIY